MRERDRVWRKNTTHGSRHARLKVPMLGKYINKGDAKSFVIIRAGYQAKLDKLNERSFA
jgi:hypothetical protein